MTHAKFEVEKIVDLAVDLQNVWYAMQEEATDITDWDALWIMRDLTEEINKQLDNLVD